MQFRRLCPEVAVTDVREAAAWYTSVLGGLPVWTWKDQMAAVRLGDAEVYLVRASQRGPSHLYLHADDIDDTSSAVTARLAAQPELGGRVLEPLSEKDWAMREMVVQDPWGNSLRLGQPLRTVNETPGYVAHEADPRMP